MGPHRCSGSHHQLDLPSSTYRVTATGPINRPSYHPSVIFQKPIHGTIAFSTAGIDNPSDGLRASEKGLAVPITNQLADLVSRADRATRS